MSLKERTGNQFMNFVLLFNPSNCQSMCLIYLKSHMGISSYVLFTYATNQCFKLTLSYVLGP